MTIPENILIDARALQHGYKAHKIRGIGYYSKNLIMAYLQEDSKYRFTFLQERGLPVDSLLMKKPLLFYTPYLKFSSPLKYLESYISLSWTIPRRAFILAHFLSHEDASLLTPCPFIVTVHDIITLAMNQLYSVPRQIKYKFVHTVARHIVQRAVMIISVSQNTKKDLLDFYGISPEKICVVPEATEQRFFRAWLPNDILKFRMRYELPDTFLLYVGGIDPRKNVVLIFRAMKVLLEQNRYCPPIVFAGQVSDQREYPEVIKTIRSLGIEHYVKFVGYIPDEDLPMLYQTSAAFIFPSRYEGFGLPVLQAMAAGTPVITTKLSSIPEVAGDAALYIDPDDPSALAQGIAAFLTNTDLRHAFIDAGKRQSAKFSWTRTITDTFEVYDEAIKRLK